MKKLPIFTAVVSVALIVVCVLHGPLKGQRSRFPALTRQKPRLAAAPLRLAQNKQKPKPESQDKKADQPTKDLKKSATQILKAARDRLIGYKSVRAQILETVAIGPRKFKVVGSYLQGTDLKLRLDFKVKIGESEGSLLEVCDGQVLWTRHSISRRPTKSSKAGDDTKAKKSKKAVKVPAEVRITRRDVRKILDQAAASSNVSGNMLVAELGLGGLPALLASLERTMTFESRKEEQVDNKAFTVIRGTWNARYTKQFIEGNPFQQQGIPLYIPDRVRVYFDRETLFPRRVLYEKKDPNRNIYKPMVTLDFVKVEFDVSVNRKEFQFIPPDDVFANDVTNQYLQQLAPGKTSQQSQPSKTNKSPANQPN